MHARSVDGVIAVAVCTAGLTGDDTYVFLSGLSLLSLSLSLSLSLLGRAHSTHTEIVGVDVAVLDRILDEVAVAARVVGHIVLGECQSRAKREPLERLFTLTMT